MRTNVHYFPIPWTFAFSILVSPDQLAKFPFEHPPTLSSLPPKLDSSKLDVGAVRELFIPRWINAGRKFLRIPRFLFPFAKELAREKGIAVRSSCFHPRIRQVGLTWWLGEDRGEFHVRVELVRNFEMEIVSIGG